MSFNSSFFLISMYCSSFDYVSISESNSAQGRTIRNILGPKREIFWTPSAKQLSKANSWLVHVLAYQNHIQYIFHICKWSVLALIMHQPSVKGNLSYEIHAGCHCCLTASSHQLGTPPQVLARSCSIFQAQHLNSPFLSHSNFFQGWEKHPCSQPVKP